MRLVVRHLTNEHEPNVYRSGYGTALSECANLLVLLVQRCPLQRYSKILPQVVEHGHISTWTSHNIPSRQKRIVFLYSVNVCFVYDILRGIRNDSVIGAPAHITGHRGA